MGLRDDKKNVFTTIGAYTSLREERSLPDTTDLYPSVNNKDDTGGFLLDVLGVVVGTAALQQLTGEFFTNFADTIEPTLKDSTKKQLIDYNSGDDLPNSFKSNGVQVPVKDIDVNGKLKNDPNSDIGSLTYNNANDNFDSKAYNAIQNEGTPIEYNNMTIEYKSFNDSFTFKPTSASQNKNIGEWFGDYVDDTEFLNKKEFMTNTMNNVFGTVSSNEGKSSEIIFSELEINKLLQQVIEGDDSFTISDDDLADLLSLAEQLRNGSVSYDMGCGNVQSELSLSGLTDLISQISGSTDPFAVGNAINNTLANSFEETDPDGVSDENAETIRNGFFDRIIQFIQLELTKLLTTSPQARMLLAISSSFQNNGTPQTSSPKEDLEKFKVYIKCIIKDVLALLYEFIFNLIVAALVALIVPVIKEIIKEIINQYIGVIKSLISSDI